MLVLDTNHLDYVRQAEDLKLVADRIRQVLRLSPFQAELPFIHTNQEEQARGLFWMALSG